MNENNLIEINSSRFEVAKTELHELSEKFKITYDLKKVKTDAGPFGMFDHSVTGEELNDSLSEIQKTFINVSESLTTVHDQLDIVYTICDALDKDYLRRIQNNLKLANKGIIDAKSASEAANSASNDALSAYKKAIEALEKLQQEHKLLALVVDKLSEKSSKIDELEQLIQENKEIKELKKQNQNNKKLRKYELFGICFSFAALCLSIINFLISKGII